MLLTWYVDYRELQTTVNYREALRGSTGNETWSHRYKDNHKMAAVK